MKGVFKMEDLQIKIEQLRQKYIAKDAEIQKNIKEIESDLENIKGEEILQSVMQEDLSVKQAVSDCFKTFILELRQCSYAVIKSKDSGSF